MTGTLSDTPADIIQQLLIDLSLGTAPSDGGTFPIYISNEPDKPDSVITIINTSPVDQGRFMINGQRQERLGIEILIRSANEPTASDKAKDIFNALDTIVYQDQVNLTAGTYLVHSAKRISGPLYLGKDSPSSERYRISINATFALEQTA